MAKQYQLIASYHRNTFDFIPISKENKCFQKKLDDVDSRWLYSTDYRGNRAAAFVCEREIQDDSLLLINTVSGDEICFKLLNPTK